MHIKLIHYYSVHICMYVCMYVFNVCTYIQVCPLTSHHWRLRYKVLHVSVQVIRYLIAQYMGRLGGVTHKMAPPHVLKHLRVNTRSDSKYKRKRYVVNYRYVCKGNGVYL